MDFLCIVCDINVDFVQIVIELFVTFLGFALAIIGERITVYIKSRSDAKELKILIKEELENVYIDLKQFDEGTLDIQPLTISSWDSACNTGQLSLLNFTTRDKLFRVYNNIKEFNSWCLVQTNYYFEKEKLNVMLIEELRRIKKDLLKDNYDDEDLSILKVIKMLEEER